MDKTISNESGVLSWIIISSDSNVTAIAQRGDVFTSKSAMDITSVLIIGEIKVERGWIDTRHAYAMMVAWAESG